MERYTLIDVCSNPDHIPTAAAWFHEKWNIPLEAYLESMQEGRRAKGLVPSWYVLKDGDRIIAGVGVIENDFHLRRDLSPNVCALFVEPDYRCQGLAGDLLGFLAKKFEEKGIGTLYLVTEHTSFYERYGWEFFCMAQEEDSDHMTRLYRHSRM